MICLSLAQIWLARIQLCQTGKKALMEITLGAFRLARLIMFGRFTAIDGSSWLPFSS
jgi:hypothetical protein